MQAICSKVVCEIELAIVMADKKECDEKEIKCAETEIKLEKECVEKEIKRLFEGECCSLSYNDDDEWFDDEDEEFVFDPKGSNKWFEDALVAGMQEQEEMQWGFMRKDDEEKVEEKNLKTMQLCSYGYH
jgi:hypothetical protein